MMFIIIIVVFVVTTIVNSTEAVPKRSAVQLEAKVT